MTGRFAHPDFDRFDFSGIPVNRDVCLMDECWIDDYEKALVSLFNGGDYEEVGYIAPVTVRCLHEQSAEVWWYPNHFDRFHRVPLILPRSAFVAGVDFHRWDEKPRVFVRQGWLDDLYLKPYSSFAMIDAIGVKRALLSCELGEDKLSALREQLDNIAESHEGIAVVSLADSILIKANWQVGNYKSEVNYSYAPESMISLLPEFFSAIRETLGLGAYCVLTQGFNQYPDLSPLSASRSARHISLNSLGVPFAQLLEIDGAVRQAIRAGVHPGGELYIDEDFMHSLRMKLDFDRDGLVRAPYGSSMRTEQGSYYVSDLATIISNFSES